MQSRGQFSQRGVPVLTAPDWWDIIKSVLPGFLIGEAALIISLLLAYVTDVIDGLLDLGPMRYGTDRIIRTFFAGTVVGIGAAAWWLGRLAYPGGYLLSTFLGRKPIIVHPDELIDPSGLRAVILFDVEEYPGYRILAFEHRRPDGIVVASYAVNIAGTKLDRMVPRSRVVQTGRWVAERIERGRCEFWIGLPNEYRSGVDNRSVDSRLLPHALPPAAQYLVHRTNGRVAVHRLSSEGEFAGYTIHSDLDAARRQVLYEWGEWQ